MCGTRSWWHRVTIIDHPVMTTGCAEMFPGSISSPVETSVGAWGTVVWTHTGQW